MQVFFLKRHKAIGENAARSRYAAKTFNLVIFWSAYRPQLSKVCNWFCFQLTREPKWKRRFSIFAKTFRIDISLSYLLHIKATTDWNPNADGFVLHFSPFALVLLLSYCALLLSVLFLPSIFFLFFSPFFLTLKSLKFNEIQKNNRTKSRTNMKWINFCGCPKSLFY